jgi:hypothetical protein
MGRNTAKHSTHKRGPYLTHLRLPPYSRFSAELAFVLFIAFSLFALVSALSQPYLCVLHEYQTAPMARRVQRMEQARLPKEVLKWRPSGRRKRGRPKLTWAEWVRGMMGEKGLKEEDWTDRSNWRRKITYLRNGCRKMWKHCTAC